MSMKNLGSYDSFGAISFGFKKKKTRFIVIEEDSSNEDSRSVSLSNNDKDLMKEIKEDLKSQKDLFGLGRGATL